MGKLPLKKISKGNRKKNPCTFCRSRDFLNQFLSSITNPDYWAAGLDYF